MLSDSHKPIAPRSGRETATIFDTRESIVSRVNEIKLSWDSIQTIRGYMEGLPLTSPVQTALAVAKATKMLEQNMQVELPSEENLVPTTPENLDQASAPAESNATSAIPKQDQYELTA